MTRAGQAEDLPALPLKMYMRSPNKDLPTIDSKDLPSTQVARTQDE